jgi:hypothetical protein
VGFFEEGAGSILPFVRFPGCKKGYFWKLVRGKWVCTKKIIVKREYSITLIIICTYS